ncbi:hypothetical protein NP233_g11906 [Leucocoprinus birnbaumii]|uniref:Uncharacterized protein n=1 Tax=Leucocoprinus birnbaumii TaxID=56174 RepID=A0AAD5YKX3_9AGAR|nr:hypothetical protein NP233_g11906 [Leucocoprinus birnbaumii]
MACPLTREHTSNYLAIGLLFGIDNVGAKTESYVNPPGPHENQLFKEELLRHKAEVQQFQEKQRRVTTWRNTLVNASTSQDYLERPPTPLNDG